MTPLSNADFYMASVNCASLLAEAGRFGQVFSDTLLLMVPPACLMCNFCIWHERLQYTDKFKADFAVKSTRDPIVGAYSFHCRLFDTVALSLACTGKYVYSLNAEALSLTQIFNLEF